MSPSPDNPPDASCPQCRSAVPRGAKFCPNCGHAIEPSPALPGVSAGVVRHPTALGAGRYQIRELVGEGTRKRVYRAEDTLLGRAVAVAAIKTEGLDEAALARIHREAQAMARLGAHPHIVTIHDLGEENGQPYIVSQLMEGGDLAARTLPIGEALRIADQICQALEYAHGQGVVHRDLKPSNVFLTNEGTAKLGDFGLARSAGDAQMTLDGAIVGTVAYMAPEQALGRADARADLYALGAVLYEMITGRPPFVGDDPVTVIGQHLQAAPVAPSRHNSAVPAALDALILRLLAKDPAERPASAAAVRGTLAACARAVAALAEAPDAATAAPTALDALASGVFVGRERETQTLRAALAGALTGQGRLVTLVGEPGIGKTRMAEELATYARLRGAEVLIGRCYEGEGAPAYWPWVQVVRSYVQAREPATWLADMGPGAADIADMVPELRQRVPDLPVTSPLESRLASVSSIV